MDLAQFLLARIAEDEAAVTGRDLTRPIHFVGCYYYSNSLDAGLHCDCDEDGDASRRYLAECQAKRELLLLADPYDFADDGGAGMSEHADKIHRLLAMPYADHPDYREEWRS